MCSAYRTLGETHEVKPSNAIRRGKDLQQTKPTAVLIFECKAEVKLQKIAADRMLRTYLVAFKR